MKIFNSMDLSIVKNGLEIHSIDELEDAIKSGVVVKLGSFSDLQAIYSDIVSDVEMSGMTFNIFKREFDKGYAKSGISEISRLIKLSDGIYYDTMFC